MTEIDLYKRAKKAVDEYGRANNEFAIAVANERAEALEARQKAIKALNAIPEVKETRYKITRFKKWFYDMIPAEKHFSYDDIMICPDDENSNSAGMYHPAGVIFITRGFECSNIVILHEMIHLHIERMTEAERVECYSKLLKKISRKIPNFDIVLGLKDSVLINNRIRSGKEPPDPVAHDNLFFVKSLDLDYRMKEDPGTVFGYDMKDTLADIDNALKTVEGLRLEMQYLRID